jgi:hypothetical protein
MMLLVLAVGAAGAGCASNGAGGTGGSSASGGSTGSGGNSSGSGGSNSGSGGNNSGSGGVVILTGSGGNGSGGSSASGGTSGSGGSGSGGSVSSGGNTGSGGNGSGGSTSSGGNTGSGGTIGSGGNTSTGGTIGSGGSTAKGGSSGTGGNSATGGATGTGGAAGSNGSGGTSGCPSNATFCSDFESPGLPTGAIYQVNAAPGDWSRDFAIDTSQHHAGASSLLVKNQSASGSSGSAYRMLAVPGTAGAFWVRFWIESDMPIGGTDHNAFAGGSIGSMPNDLMIEFAEDVGIAFNTSDQDQWPTGYGRLSGGGTKNYTLPAMTWECVEISYDGTGKEQQLFINNVQLIDAKNYPTSTEALTYFKFGFNAYHGPARQVWYDDVAVAPTRIGGCPTVAMSNI